MASANELQFKITADTISAQDALKVIQQRFVDIAEASKKASNIFQEVQKNISQIATSQADVAFRRIQQEELNATTQAQVLKESMKTLDQQFRTNIIDSENYSKAIHALYQELQKLGGANAKIDSKMFDYLAVANFDAELKKLIGDEIKLQNETQLLNATLSKLRQEYASGAITLEQFRKIQASIYANANPNALSIGQSAINSYNQFKDTLIATERESKVATQTFGLLQNKISEISQLQANNAFLKIQESEAKATAETRILIESMKLLESEFTKGGTNANTYANAIKHVSDELKKISTGTKLDAKMFDPIAVANYDQALKQLINDEIKLQNETNILNSTLHKAEQAFQAGTISAEQFRQIQAKILASANPNALSISQNALLTYDQAKQKIQETEQKLQSLKMALAQANAEFLRTGQGKKVIEELNNQLKQLGEHTSVFGKIAEGLKGLFNGLSNLVGPAMMAYQAMSMLITKLLEINEVENKLHAVVVSEKLFADAMEYTADIAKRYGQDLLQVRSSYASFMGSAQQTNLTLDQSKLAFEGVSAAGAALHLSTQKMGFAFLALEQMMSKGVVQTQELRRQLGEHLPGSMAIAAKTLGITVDVLVKKLEAGQIAAVEFVTKFAAELKNVYGQLAELIADESPVAAINRLKNAWTEAVETMSKNGLNESIKRSSDMLTQSINESQDAIVSLGKAIGFLIEFGASFMSLMGGFAQLAEIIFVKPFKSLDVYLNGIDQANKHIELLDDSTKNLIARINELQNAGEFKGWFDDATNQAKLLDEEFLKQVKTLETLNNQKKEILKSQIDETEKQSQLIKIDDERTELAEKLKVVMGSQRELAEAQKQANLQLSEIEARRLGITTAAFAEAKKLIDNINSTSNEQLKSQDKLSQILKVIDEQRKQGFLTEQKAYEARMVATEKYKSESQKVSDELLEQAKLAGLIGVKHEIVSEMLKQQKQALKEDVVLSDAMLQKKIEELTVIKMYEDVQKRINKLQDEYKKFISETVNAPVFKMPDLKNLYEVELKYSEFKEFAKNNKEELVKLEQWHQDQTTAIQKKLVDQVNKNVADHHKAIVDLKNNLQKAYSDINKIEHESKEQSLQLSIELKEANDKLVADKKANAEQIKQIQDGIVKSNADYNKAIFDAEKEHTKTLEDINKSVSDAYANRDKAIADAIKSINQASAEYSKAVEDSKKSEIESLKAIEQARIEHAQKLKEINQSIIDKQLEFANQSKEIASQKIQIEKDYQDQLKSLQEQALSSQQDYEDKLYAIKTRNLTDDEKQSEIQKQIKAYIAEAEKLSASGDLTKAQDKLKKAMDLSGQIKNDQNAINALNDAYDALKKVEEKIYQKEKIKAEDEYQAKVKENLEEQKKLQTDFNAFLINAMSEKNKANQEFADAEAKRNQDIQDINQKLADAQQRLIDAQIDGSQKIQEAQKQANDQINEANQRRFDAEQKLMESRNQAEFQHNEELKKFAKEQDDLDEKKRIEAEKQQLILKEIQLLESELAEAKANNDKDEIKRIGEKLIALGKTLDDTTKMSQVVNDGFDAVNKARDMEISKIKEGAEATKAQLDIKIEAYNKELDMQKNIQAEMERIKDVARSSAKQMFDDFNTAFTNLKNVGSDATQAIISNMEKMINYTNSAMKKYQTIQSGVANNYSSTTNDNLDNVAPFATGGLIQGPGTGTSDSIMAMVSNGEYVINAETVAKFGVGFFDKINFQSDQMKRNLEHVANRMTLPRYASGGVVSTTNHNQSQSVANVSHSSSFTIQNLHLNGIQDVKSLVKELESYSRGNPISLNIGNKFSKNF